MVDDWFSFLTAGTDNHEQTPLRRHECSGRPLSSRKLVRKLEKSRDRVLRPQKGRRPRKNGKN